MKGGEIMMTVQKAVMKDKAKIMKMITSDKPFKEILQYIVKSIEEYCMDERVYGAIMLYNPSSNQLTEAVSASLSGNFIQAIGAVDISPYGGSSGIAAYLKKPVFVADIENNPIWDKNRHIALVHGFRASLSIPLLSSNQELLGTIELYSSQIGAPNEETLKIIDIFSKLAVLTIEVLSKNNRQSLYSFEMEHNFKEKVDQKKRFFFNVYPAVGFV